MIRIDNFLFSMTKIKCHSSTVVMVHRKGDSNHSIIGHIYIAWSIRWFQTLQFGACATLGKSFIARFQPKSTGVYEEEWQIYNAICYRLHGLFYESPGRHKRWP